MRWLKSTRAAALTAFVLAASLQLLFTALLRLIVVPVLLPASHMHHGLQRASDSLFFHGLAVEVSAGLRSLGWSALSSELLPGLLHTKVLGVIYFLAGTDSPYVIYVLNALIVGATAALFVFTASLLVPRSPVIAGLAFVPVAFSPLVLFSHSELLREPFALFFGAVWVAGLVAGATLAPDATSRGRAAGVLLMVVGFTGVAGLRPYLMLPLMAGSMIVLAVLAAAWLADRRTRAPFASACATVATGALLAYLLVIRPGWLEAFQYDRRGATEAVAEAVRATGAAKVEALRRKSAGQEPAQIEREDVLIPSVCTVAWRQSNLLPGSLDDKFEAIACSRQGFIRYCDQALLGLRADRHCDEFIPTSAGQLIAHVPKAMVWGVAVPLPPMWFDGFGSAGTGLRRAGYTVDGVMSYLLLPGVLVLVARIRRHPVAGAVALALLAVTTIYALAVPSQFILARMRLAVYAPLLALGWVGIAEWLVAHSRRARAFLEVEP